MRVRTLCLLSLLSPFPLPTAAQGKVDPAPVQPNENIRVSFDFEELPLRDAIRQAFFASGLQYSVGPKVPNVPVNLKLRDVSVSQALRLIVRQAESKVPGLSAVKDRDVFVIDIRPVEPREPGARRPMEAPSPLAEIVSEKVLIRHLDAAQVARSLGGTAVTPLPLTPRGRPGGKPEAEPTAAPLPVSLLLRPDSGTTVIAGPADNSLVVTGPKEEIRKVREVLEYLDVPGRQVRLRVSAGALAAEGRVRTGSTLRLTDTAGKDRIDFRLMPRMGVEGDVVVTIDGTLSTGGTTRSTTTSVSVMPGKATPVLTLGADKRAVRLWLKLELLPSTPN